jgi:Zn-finger nucleic acid-binding protein
MLISREREYRADAASVRMTRNPLAMAEALHLIARNWKGSGLIGNGLEMLCIINPQENEMDDAEGFWANLLSTHPPIRKRIDILLKMVRVSMAELDRKVSAETHPVSSQAISSNKKYYALDPKHAWQGPYTPGELSLLPWMLPLTWIKSDKGNSVERAMENTMISELFTSRIHKNDQNISEIHCPACRQPLRTIPYERTNVYQCVFCRGTLVGDTKIPRIIARREKECTERVKQLAKAVTADNLKRIAIKKVKGKDSVGTPLTVCPKCGNPMLRTFYSLAYLIEIDRCGICNITWFEADELEMLQCIIENKMTAHLDYW